MSEKHLNRYVSEFAGRFNQRPLDTMVQMECMAKGLDGKAAPVSRLGGENNDCIV